jgi:WD40 repeat protein
LTILSGSDGPLKRKLKPSGAVHKNRRTVRRNRWVIAGMLLLTFAGLIFAAFQKTDKQRTQSLLSTALSALGGSATAFGAEVLTLRGFSDDVSGVAWSPDSGRLATSVLDKVAKVWNLSDGKGLFTLNGHHGDVYSVAWSPDGKRLASASKDTTAKAMGCTFLHIV